MTDIIPKKLGEELPIPMLWQAPLKAIADEFVVKRPHETHNFDPFERMDEDNLKISLKNIANYPDKIGGLSEKSWETSVCVWTGTFWEILLDLTDYKGNVSDLVLHGKMLEDGKHYIFKPYLIYVP